MLKIPFRISYSIFHPFFLIYFHSFPINIKNTYGTLTKEEKEESFFLLCQLYVRKFSNKSFHMPQLPYPHEKKRAGFLIKSNSFSCDSLSQPTRSIYWMPSLFLPSQVFFCER
ncbi:hypothetical protein EGX98_07890 [Fusobacterium necrophorum]|nr:hypothetical protein EGX98_07890 [Fusobacterium necrophorum]